MPMLSNVISDRELGLIGFLKNGGHVDLGYSGAKAYVQKPGENGYKALECMAEADNETFYEVGIPELVGEVQVWPYATFKKMR